jgi:uncharacterized protein YyaL (SSP411 family)
MFSNDLRFPIQLMPAYTNKLINETSPYLLQHAHNPVDWYPWSDEALQKAKQENKPILVSIGYSACHWCHVMEKESFEDEGTAAIMNERFINIKIDREERPDLDHVYMDAVQAMTGSGGWPLNVFLTPELKPFYGGTYFPLQRAFNRPSWKEILNAVSGAFREKRDEIDLQAENLTEHLQQSNSFGLQAGDQKIFCREKLDECFQSLMKTADKEWGGFDKAPKFPQTFSIQFLLRYHYVTKNEEALKQALISLDKMIEGGFYDQIGGGFARYSTDNEWLVPHFEKMLYDNALLISVLSEAYQLTKKENYNEVIEKTFGFIERELMHPDGGFYAALDADSEGEEGKFYVWGLDEVKNLLGDNADILCQYFNITEKGNWEGENILRTKKSLEKFAEEKNILLDELRSIIKNGKEKLLTERNKRVRPGLDDKILLNWNALMNTACSKAFAATGMEKFRQLAIGNMQFLLDNFSNGNDRLYHSWKNGKQKHNAFLDDYAFLIQALIQLQEITGKTEFLLKAKQFAEQVIDNFSEEETGFFFFTSLDQKDVIVRKKEVYDGATPSGNSVMMYNFHHLSVLFDLPEWRERAEKTVSSLGDPIIKYPTSFGIWACLLQEIIDGTQEIAVVGKNFSSLTTPILAEYIPHKILMMSENSSENFPLLANKGNPDSALIYLCKGYACQQPVTSLTELLKLLSIRNNNW